MKPTYNETPHAGKIRLYHVGFSIIDNPDIYYGKKNADFGQGFYMSDNEEFSHRWAKIRPDRKTYINTYELELDGLNIKHFDRDEEWFKYIFDNRRGKDDSLSDYDVITGPIANDTIYDVMGITTSGYLDDSDALKLLSVGPIYCQVAIKTPLARMKLKWLGSEELKEQDLTGYRAMVATEEQEFRILFARKLSEITGEEYIK